MTYPRNPHLTMYRPAWMRVAWRIFRPVLEAAVLGGCGWLVILVAIWRAGR